MFHRPIPSIAVAALALGVLTTGAQAIDPASYKSAWSTDFSNHAVPYREIIAGGPPKDGIPSIDDPSFVAMEDADLSPTEPVIGLTIDGEAKAYPLRVMTWHEIVNDTVGGTPVAVTYCPLCNAALVFERVVDGAPTTFGTTGLLRNSDLVMYDRATETWWQQFTGKAIVGEHTGAELTLLPSRLESFAQFAKRHPDGRVLVPNDPNARRYGRNPYVGYDSRREPYPLYTGTLPEDVDPMIRVVVLREPEAVVSLNALREAGTMTVDGVTLSWRKGQTSALDAAEIAQGRDVGTVTAQRGGEDVAYDVTFAFVAHAFMPDVEVRR